MTDLDPAAFLRPVLVEAGHIPTIAEMGYDTPTWGVHCWLCSRIAEDYVWPCREGVDYDVPAELVATRRSTPDPEHPERSCWRCSGPNIAWSAPSPLWNQVMRGGDINGSEIHHGIVCPTCFAILAEETGVAKLWMLRAERVHVPLQTVTPSGRVWNDELCRWTDPDAPAAVGGVNTCPRCGGLDGTHTVRDCAPAATVETPAPDEVCPATGTVVSDDATWNCCGSAYPSSHNCPPLTHPVTTAHIQRPEEAS